MTKTAGRQTSFDLEERAARFGEETIALCKRVPVNPITAPLITQLVRAATSIGANYGEANDAQSKKDFRHKISLSRKESKESKHFLRMMAAAYEPCRAEARQLWSEAKELNLIFSAIFRSCSRENP